MQENGVNLEGNLVFGNIYVDHLGNYYVIPEELQGRVLVLGPDGDLIGQIDADRNGISIRFACKDPDGAPIFKWHDEWEDIWKQGLEHSCGNYSEPCAAVSG